MENNLLTERLTKFREDRGALANLRCALRPALKSRAWPVLSRVTGLDTPMLIVYETVVGLWASDPDNHSDNAGNFGATCQTLRGDHESFDVRFRRLLDCETRDELCERIAPIVLAAQAKGVPVDYNRLFDDLKYFGGNGCDRVRIRWASDYYRQSLEEESE